MLFQGFPAVDCSAVVDFGSHCFEGFPHGLLELVAGWEKKKRKMKLLEGCFFTRGT